KVPLLFGGNSNEASLFRPKPEQIDQAPAEVKAAYGADKDKAQAVNDFVTDSYMTEPDRNLARIEAKDGVPVWLYYVSFVPDKTRATSHGAPHTAEIRFVW